jgi:hypothetical protein
VDQAAEQILSADVSRAHRQPGFVFGHGRRKGESAMGATSVVVLGICPKRLIEMASTQDE